MPLSARERAYFEPRFGRDLSDVRIHTGDKAASAASTIHARAFTLGSEIAFARGEYRPDTDVGQRLIAHELAHVLQGRRGADQRVIRRGPVDEPGKVTPEFRIVSDVWSVTDENGISRSVVIVEGRGERQAMYERSGVSERPEGHAGPKAGDWAPFDGFRDNGRGFGHFEKDLYFRGKMPCRSRASLCRRPCSRPQRKGNLVHKKGLRLYFGVSGEPGKPSNQLYDSVALRHKNAFCSMRCGSGIVPLSFD